MHLCTSIGKGEVVYMYVNSGLWP